MACARFWMLVFTGMTAKPTPYFSALDATNSLLKNRRSPFDMAQGERSES
jgi:hypothetical protein